MPKAQNNEAPWLVAARAGSSEAMGQAFEEYRGYLLSIAQKELDPALQAKGGASDLVQETFLEAQRDFGQFQGKTGEELRAWLRRLLQNNLANFARNYRDTDKRRISREQSLECTSASHRTGGLAAALPSPSGQAISREQTEALMRALERLPEDYGQVVLLRYREERTFEEIGEIMGRTGNAIRKIWLRAVKRLNEELKGLT